MGDWLAPQDIGLGSEAPRLGLWPPPSGSYSCGQEALPVHLAPRMSSSDISGLLLREWPPLPWGGLVIKSGQRELMLEDEGPGWVARAPGPQVSVTHSGLVPCVTSGD